MDDKSHDFSVEAIYSTKWKFKIGDWAFAIQRRDRRMERLLEVAVEEVSEE